MDGCLLRHLWFADDVVLLSSDPHKLGAMLQELKEAAEKSG